MASTQMAIIFHGFKALRILFDLLKECRKSNKIFNTYWTWWRRRPTGPPDIKKSWVCGMEAKSKPARGWRVQCIHCIGSIARCYSGFYNQSRLKRVVRISDGSLDFGTLDRYGYWTIRVSDTSDIGFVTGRLVACFRHCKDASESKRNLQFWALFQRVGQ